MKRIVAAVVGVARVFVVVALLTSPVMASQYNLEQARQIIPRADATRLRRAGIRTTLDILIQGRTADYRRQLAASSGLSLEKISAWVLLADLMRVRGIGPDVARLLTAIGVRTVADLQRADSEQAAIAIHDANRRLHLSTNPPTAPSIQYWITQSRELPLVIE